MKEVFVCLAGGFEEIEAITVIDVLRRAEINVVTVSLSGTYEVEGAHAVIVKADRLFEMTDFGQAEMIVLPGGMPGAVNLNNHAGLLEKIGEFNRSGKLLGAICAAPMILGGLGILEGRDVTCYPGFEKYCRNARIQPRKVVTDGNIVTGKGAGVAMEFALALVEKLKGRECKEQVAEKMLVPGY